MIPLMVELFAHFLAKNLKTSGKRVFFAAVSEAAVQACKDVQAVLIKAGYAGGEGEASGLPGGETSDRLPAKPKGAPGARRGRRKRGSGPRARSRPV